jgi:hypothetical protein
MAIREAIQRDGREAGEGLSLMVISGDDQAIVAMQNDLVRLAEKMEFGQTAVRKFA